MSRGHRGRDADRSTSSHVEVLPAMGDPRVASALEAYLAELEAGRRPSRDELLEDNPEIAGALAGCLEILELVHSAAGAASSDGPLPQLKDALPPDTILGEYRLAREIGRGGMGIVYEAEQVSLGRRVALKVLSGTARRLDPHQLQRFRVETQAVNSPSPHHPHIVPISRRRQRGARPTTTRWQYIDGPTLQEAIHQRRRARLVRRRRAGGWVVLVRDRRRRRRLRRRRAERGPRPGLKPATEGPRFRRRSSRRRGRAHTEDEAHSWRWRGWPSRRRRPSTTRTRWESFIATSSPPTS